MFVALVPGEFIVERGEFESTESAYAGAMTVTTTFTPTVEGTRVDIVCQNVPDGISAGDHQAGLASTLASLPTPSELCPSFA